MSSPQRSIPPHLRESVFRTYEPALSDAVRWWPQETLHRCPADLSFVTFLAGLRNAVNSVLTFDWETTIDKDKLKLMRKEQAFVVTPHPSEPNAAFFRAPGRRDVPTKSIDVSIDAPSVLRPPSGLVPARDMTEEQMRAFVTLLDAGLVVGPILVKGRHDVLLETTVLSNVSVTYDETKDETILL